MYLENKAILITGGTGSMGKTLIKTILSGVLGTPKKVVVFSRDEAKQHAMRASYLHKKYATDEIIYSNFLNVLEFRIGDICSYEDICSALRGVDIVINTAALKQVPVCEYFPFKALMTNCDGANNIIRAIQEHDLPVETVVGISTDKACKPVNVMGMTKALQERLFIAANVCNPKTRFVCVRYGNVLASRGSVVPLFLDQIQHGGPVTLTSPHMTRFLQSLDHAVETVVTALQFAKPGEIYVPIAPAALVKNIALALIGESGVEIKITGIRPGEKVEEVLISEEEAARTVKRNGYYVIKPMLPELCDVSVAGEITLNACYSSTDSVLSLGETRVLLKVNGLLSGEICLEEELLR